MQVIEKDRKRYFLGSNQDMQEIKYGLPGKVKFCKKCVISNQRPSSTPEFQHRPESTKQTIHFDENGICDACRYAEMKDVSVDWDDREEQLKVICDKYRSRNGSYDCLVPGSGGKDSIYASHILKTLYGMHPLTVTWAPHLYTDVGWRNFQSWVHEGGFDNYLFTPNGEVHRKLTRLATQNLLHPFQPFILGQKNFAPRIAAQFGIPLVFYGENEAEYGNPIDQNISAQRDTEYYVDAAGGPNELYFGGVPMSELGQYGIRHEHLEPYMPPKADDIKKSELEVQYLGYYLKWTPQECYYYAAEKVGFEANTERTEGTYSKYHSIDDKIDGYHFWTTYIKFGIGRASYDASQEIRNHHITREEGVALVRRFDGEFPRKFFADFLNYVSMEEEEFLELADQFRSPHLWRKSSEGWFLRHQIA